MTSLPPSKITNGIHDALMMSPIKNRILAYGVAGSRGFNMETETSDYDVKGIYSLSVDELIGISPHPTQFLQIIPELNVSLNFRDVGVLTKHIIKGNGSALEDVVVHHIFEVDQFKAYRRAMVGCVTRQYADHYLGYMHSEWKLLIRKEENIKAALHMLRNVLQGIHLMNTGELEMNITHLALSYDCPLVIDIIGSRRGGATRLTSGQRSRLVAENERLVAALRRARGESPLPEVLAPDHLIYADNIVRSLRRHVSE